MLAKMTTIIRRYAVFPERMLRNLESTHGLVYSGQLLQDLVEKGMPRDDADKAVQENAMAAWETESSFQERVATDARITKYLDAKALAHTFDLQRQLRYVDAIFDRVFGAHPAGESPPPTTPKKKWNCRWTLFAAWSAAELLLPLFFLSRYFMHVCKISQFKIRDGRNAASKNAPNKIWFQKPRAPVARGPFASSNFRSRGN